MCSSSWNEWESKGSEHPLHILNFLIIPYDFTLFTKCEDPGMSILAVICIFLTKISSISSI